MQTKAHNIHQKPTKQVGFVLKPHGFKGQLRITLDQEYIPNDFLFIEINRKFVPFSIQSFNADSGIIKLSDFNSLEEVQSLVNLPIVELLEAQETLAPSLLGYTLQDQVSGLTFEIINVVEFPGNVLIEFRHGFKDALIPMHEDIIKLIDHKNKLVFAEFPEGILDL